MSSGRPTMRNYLDRTHELTLEHVAKLSNSDILSKSLDEWVAQLEHVPPQLNQGDSRGAEDGRGYRH